MTSTNGILAAYDIINYIRRYLLKQDIANFAIFPYFEYDNLLYVVLNGLNGGIIENNIIYVNYHKIYINENNNLYEIFIEFNDLIEPTGPL